MIVVIGWLSRQPGTPPKPLAILWKAGLDCTESDHDKAIEAARQFDREHPGRDSRVMRFRDDQEDSWSHEAATWLLLQEIARLEGLLADAQRVPPAPRKRAPRKRAPRK